MKGLGLPWIKITIMQHKYLLLTLLAVSAFAVGCEQSEKSESANREATAKQLDKVKTETKEAAQEMKDYTYAQKTEFVDKMQAEMAGINRELDELAAKIDKASDTAKAEAKPKLQALREQAAKLNQQLDKAKSATESTWDDVKAGTKKAYGDLKDAFQQARQWVSDKIAP
jgi:cytochrome c556